MVVMVNVNYRVLIAERDKTMLDRLANVVQNIAEFELVATYQDVHDALGQGSVFAPNLLLLDADETAVENLLGDFRRVYPHAFILCMGKEWQTENVRRLAQAGANAYLIKPFSADELQEAVRSFAEPEEEGSAKTLVFFSPKGKSGKTTLIANLAMALARYTKESVGIVDSDLQFGDLGVFFNLSPKSTIVEAARDIHSLSSVTLKSYFTPVSERVSVLCGAARPEFTDLVTVDAFETILNMSQRLFRYILVDVPQGFNAISIAAAEASTTTYLVTMLNGAYELEHMRRALEIFKDWPDYETRAQVVLTRAPAERRTELEQKLGYPIEAMIPNEYLTVSDAVDHGKMVIDLAPGNPLVQAVDQMARQIARQR